LPARAVRAGYAGDRRSYAMSDLEEPTQQLVSELRELRERVAELEKAAHDKETETERLLQSAPLGIHECDATGRITFVNRSQERTTGYTADELLGTYIWDRIVPGPEKDALPAHLAHLVSDQPPPTPFLAKNIRRNGELYDIRVDWNYKRDAQGQVTGFVCIVSDVTEQRRAEEQLRHSERTLRTLMDASPESVLLIAADETILFVNATMAKRFGTTVDKIIGRTSYDLVSPQLAAQRMERLHEVVRTGKALHFEDQRAGRHYEIAMHPIFDEQGKVAAVAVLAIDQTDHKQAQDVWQQARDELEARVDARTAELLKANRELAIFRRFVESSQQGFAMARLSGEITYVNPAIARVIADGAPEDMIGKHVSAFYSEEYLHRREMEVLPSVLREGHWQGEVTFSHRGGSIFALQHSFLVRDEQGDPAYFATVFTDITERKQAEEALRQAHDQLRAIYDGIIEGLLITDVDTKRIVRANSAMCRMLGYSKEELLEASIRDIHPPEAVADDLQRFQAIAESQASVQQERPVLRKDGSVFYADITGQRIVYEGRPCVLAFFRDVSERKQAQEALQREHRTLKHLLESSDHERQLIAYEIHDGLAQQLAGAIMQFQTFSHLKDRQPQPAAKAYDAGMTMLQQGHFEARRLIAGVRPPVLDEEGIVAAVAHLVHEQSRLEKANIEYRSRVDFDRLAPTLENAIYRIAQEGLANACQHSRSKEVRVSLLQRKDHVRIEVQDWGVGFQPKQVRKGCYGLLGMRQRARLLGGKCSIRSTLGNGTRVTVELPIVLTRSDAESAE
jgi:PAS domain S-box-containing protein